MADSDDLRTFIREIMARSDRGFREMRARSEEIAREAAEERRLYFEKLAAKDEEIFAENRAQREALDQADKAVTQARQVIDEADEDK